MKQPVKTVNPGEIDTWHNASYAKKELVIHLLSACRSSWWMPSSDRKILGAIHGLA